MKKNETYKKVEHKLYDFFEQAAYGAMATGGVFALLGYATGNKEVASFGYGVLMTGGAWKIGAILSVERFKPVSELEEKVEEEK